MFVTARVDLANNVPAKKYFNNKLQFHCYFQNSALGLGFKVSKSHIMNQHFVFPLLFYWLFTVRPCLSDGISFLTFCWTKEV